MYSSGGSKNDPQQFKYNPRTLFLNPDTFTKSQYVHIHVSVDIVTHTHTERHYMLQILLHNMR